MYFLNFQDTQSLQRNKAKTPFQILRTRTWNPQELIILVDSFMVEFQDSYKSPHCSVQILQDRSLSTWCVCLSFMLESEP